MTPSNQKKQYTSEEAHEKILLCANDIGHYDRQIKSLLNDIKQINNQIDALQRKICKKHKYIETIKKNIT